MRSLILNREQQPARCFAGILREKKPQPSLEELEREVEVLRGKLRSLELAHLRVEREVQRLTDQLQAVRSTARTKASKAAESSYKATA
jgi:chaperonin cofactor prefoldin